jgi:hypothetical protein
MNHERFKEWLHLSLAGELANQEKRLLDAHLEECGECRTMADDVRGMLARLRESRIENSSDELLREARLNLREAIRGDTLLGVTRTRRGREAAAHRERAMWGGSRVALGRWTEWLAGFRPALVGASALAAGVFIGYLAFGRMGAGLPAPTTTEVAGEMGRPDIANVRFVDMGAKDGSVEIEYDLVRPVRLRGTVGDERVQRVLARALESDDNAGVRIKAVGALSVGTTQALRPEVKLAIMEAAKTDPNAGVRKEALRVLLGYPFDSDIEAACLYILEHDDNPGMRVASLNLLSGARMSGHAIGPEIYQYLSDTPESDSWVKAQSAVFFEEVRDE